ncbi:hypothetical protein MMC24_000745 [Lignoscripta atroalba]|nr:hypothetical protein [Lignoscripta atroalba]
MTDPPPTLISLTTILSLLTTLSILLTAYLLSLRLLPPTTTPPKLRILYIWHLFDALTHFLLEGSFLYISFSTYIARQPQAITSDYPHPASLGSSSSSTAAAAAGGRGPVSYFLGYEDRLYGPKYGTSPLARLWQEYAKADRRWGEADTTVVSLEVLTVFVAGPLALYVAELIRRTVASESGKGRGGRGRRSESGSGTGSGKLWYWATVLATCELYGG